MSGKEDPVALDDGYMKCANCSKDGRKRKEGKGAGWWNSGFLVGVRLCDDNR